MHRNGLASRTARRLALAIPLVLWPAMVLADDWPTVRRDNRRSGVSPEDLRPPLRLEWTFTPPAPPAKGWPPAVSGFYNAWTNRSDVGYDDAFHVTVAGDTAFFASSGEHLVYAVDAPSGAVRWTFRTGAPPRLAPTVWEGKAFFGADDGRVTCLKADSGTPVWTFDCRQDDRKMLGLERFLSRHPVRSGVMVHGGTAFFSAGLFPQDGIHVYGVNAADGRLLFRQPVDATPQGYPLALQDSFFITTRCAPVRFSLKDGTPVPFDTPLPAVKDASYRYYNGGSGAQVWDDKIVYGEACILGFDPDRPWKDQWGKPKRGELAFDWFNARAMVFRGDLAYVATDFHILAIPHRELAAVGERLRKDFWEDYRRNGVARLMDHYYPAIAGSLSDDGSDPRIAGDSKDPAVGKFGKWLEAAAPHFAKVREKCVWMKPRRAPETLILAGHALYAGGEDMFLALDARTGEELWRETTGSRVRGLAAAGGRLFVSTVDGRIRCYGAGRRPAPVEVHPAVEAQPFPRDGTSEACAATAGKILSATGVRRGYGLVLGGGDGRLAFELARQSELVLQVLEPDPRKTDAARMLMARAGLEGHRVVVEQAPLDRLPYPPFLFNLVLGQEGLEGGPVGTPLEEAFRVTRPCGGVLCVGRPPEACRALEGRGASVSAEGRWSLVRRGPLEGARDWTHHYATPANTWCSEDPRVKAPFDVLWYGEPGPRRRIERHANGPVPLVVNGIMFLTGYDLVMACDLYNGVLHWERSLPGTTRAQLPVNAPGIAADEGSFFILQDDARCLRLEAATGRTVQTYTVPGQAGAKYAFWGWLARSGDLLLGSRSGVDYLRKKPDGRTSTALFALDVRTGAPRWNHDGGSIDHASIAVGEGMVFFVDRKLAEAEREEARKDAVRDPSVEDRKPVDPQGSPVARDLRRIAALDAGTGALRWAKPFDMTDITLDDRAVLGRQVPVVAMVKDGVLVVCGTGSLGHPFKEYVAGEFRRRALYAFDAASGKFLWGGRKNYRKRPVIAGDHVYAEPFAWNLKTGEERKVPSPGGGEPRRLDYFRGYIGCGHLLASGAALFGSKGGIGVLNLDNPAGFYSFEGVSLACGIGAVPAGGVFAAPEGRSGCCCDVQIHTSIVLYPREAPGGTRR